MHGYLAAHSAGRTPGAGKRSVNAATQSAEHVPEIVWFFIQNLGLVLCLGFLLPQKRQFPRALPLRSTSGKSTGDLGRFRRPDTFRARQAADRSSVSSNTEPRRRQRRCRRGYGRRGRGGRRRGRIGRISSIIPRHCYRRRPSRGARRVRGRVGGTITSSPARRGPAQLS